MTNIFTIEGEGHVNALDLGSLDEGKAWDDDLPVTMTRYEWHVTLASLTQSGKATQEGIEALARRLRDNPPTNAATAMKMLEAAAGLSDTDDAMRDASLKITQVIYPEFHAAYLKVKEAHEEWEATTRKPHEASDG